MNQTSKWQDDCSFPKGYQQYFQFVPAYAEGLKQHCYRIRHEVYCQELGYEPVRRDSIEIDDYDNRSLHCLVRATRTNEFIGCARLVLHSSKQPCDTFPLERACSDNLAQGTLDFINQNRQKVAEVSRLAITPRYRKGKKTATRSALTKPQSNSQASLRLPNLALGLYLAMAALARRNGVQHILFLTEPSLVASIAPLGWKLTQVGMPIEHRGRRVPYMLNLDHNLAKMDSFIRYYYEAIKEEIESHSARAFHATAQKAQTEHDTRRTTDARFREAACHL